MVYRAPGVRIQEVPNPQLIALPSGVRIPAVVGTGTTKVYVNDAPIVKGVSSTDTIVDPTSITVSEVTAIGDVPGLSQYKQGSDFLIVNNNIDWSPSGAEPTAGSTYYVTYRTPKPATAYNNPTPYFSINDVRTDFGPELKNGNINPITSAASLMFQNGAASVMVVQATTGSVTDLETAIDALQGQDIDVVVVPQATNSTLQNYLKTHVDTQSAPSMRHERVTIIAGTSCGLSPSLSEQTGRATAMADKRVIVVSPPAAILTFKDAGTNTDADVLVPGTYSAAALAGIMTNAAFDPAEPITRKPVAGITSLSSFNYLPTQMDTLAAQGITVFENINQSIRVRQGLTTGTSNINDLAISVVLIIDDIRKTVRTALEREYIGTKILLSTPSAVATSIKAILDTKVRDKILADYQEASISVVQDQNDPRTLDISFAVAPVYPLEYMDISFSLFVAA